MGIDMWTLMILELVCGRNGGMRRCACILLWL